MIIDWANMIDNMMIKVECRHTFPILSPFLDVYTNFPIKKKLIDERLLRQLLLYDFWRRRPPLDVYPPISSVDEFDFYFRENKMIEVEKRHT